MQVSELGEVKYTLYSNLPHHMTPMKASTGTDDVGVVVISDL